MRPCNSNELFQLPRVQPDSATAFAVINLNGLEIDYAQADVAFGANRDHVTQSSPGIMWEKAGSVKLDSCQLSQLVDLLS